METEKPIIKLEGALYLGFSCELGAKYGCPGTALVFHFNNQGKEHNEIFPVALGKEFQVNQQMINRIGQTCLGLQERDGKYVFLFKEDKNGENGWWLGG